MSTIPRAVPICNAPDAEAQRRELLQRLRRRALPAIISAILDGEDSMRAADLIWDMRLNHKKRSFARDLLDWVIRSLRADHIIPANFWVVW